MSEIVETKLGRFRRVTDGKTKWFLWECPACKQWCGLTDDQWAGKVSVNHDADGCPGHYHETHNFGAELMVKLQMVYFAQDPTIIKEDVEAAISQPAVPESAQSNAIAELIDGLEHGAQVNLSNFLDWLADRLVNVYQENPNVDFVLSCQSRAKHLRALITKYGSHK